MCFSMAWLQQILILAVVACAIIAILKLIVPYALKMVGAEMGEGAQVVVGIFRILLWAVIVIAVIIIAFMAISCLWNYAGGFPALGRH